MTRARPGPRYWLAIAAAALTLAACSDSMPPPPPPPPVALEGALEIVVWPGYLGRDTADPAHDWLAPFEQETGCKVTMKAAGTADELFALMNHGGYDLATAPGDATLRLVRGGVVQPIDLARVAGYEAIDARLQQAPWHFIDGRHYGVPFLWAPNLLLYNTRVFRKAPQSWSVVFESGKFPDGKPARGRVQAYDGAIYIADAALYLMAHQPGLGISDPYALSEAQYAAALQLLRAQQPLVQRYWHDAAVQVQDYTREGVAASGSWPYQLSVLAANKRPVAGTIPAEGATAWADSTMLHARARHPNCAYRWLAWSIRPQVQRATAARFESLPAVTSACAPQAAAGAADCGARGFDQLERLHFWRTPEANCSQGSCVPFSRWSTDYVSVMGGR